jgi:hypothetical protein
MTSFPTIRRFMRASAVLVPLLLFLGFLLVASGRVVWGVVPIVAAFMVRLSIPLGLTEDTCGPRRSDGADRAWLLWVRRAAWHAILVWGLNQSEVAAFQKRAIQAGGLWDWRLLSAGAVVTFCPIVWGLKRAAAVSDVAIYAYVTAATLSGTTAA